MKEFWIYTLMRGLVFVACVLFVWVVWAAVNNGEVHRFGSLIVAFLLSGVVSYFLLDRFRENLARRVEDRAARASSRFEEMRGRED